MCNRYVSPEEAAIERHWHIGARNQPSLWPGGYVVPRKPGPFIRRVREASEPARELVIGTWGLVPWFATTPRLGYTTNNARFEGITEKASFKDAWARGKRCIIPAESFDEPNWQTGKNVWHRFFRRDGAPWGLAGLWNAWTDKATGEVFETYTLLTINANAHPVMSRMHKPDVDPVTKLPLPLDKQDKRSVVSIELPDVDTWLRGSVRQAWALVKLPADDAFDVRAEDKATGEYLPID